MTMVFFGEVLRTVSAGRVQEKSTYLMKNV